MRKLYHFILNHLLELACIQVLIIALFPLLIPKICVCSDDYFLFLLLPGMIIGGSVAASYSIYEIGEKKLFKINAWWYLIFTVLVGLIAQLYAMSTADEFRYENVTIYQKFLAPYQGFLIGGMILACIKICIKMEYKKKNGL